MNDQVGDESGTGLDEGGADWLEQWRSPRVAEPGTGLDEGSGYSLDRLEHRINLLTPLAAPGADAPVERRLPDEVLHQFQQRQFDGSVDLDAPSPNVVPQFQYDQYRNSVDLGARSPNEAPQFQYGQYRNSVDLDAHSPNEVPQFQYDQMRHSVDENDRSPNEVQQFQFDQLNKSVPGPVGSRRISDRQMDFVRNVYDAALENEKVTGVPAAVVTAQAIKESTYGEKVPKDIDDGTYSYNLFGVKARPDEESVTDYTHEYENGKRVGTLADFAAYNSFQDSLQGRADFIRKNPRYKSLSGVTDPVEYAHGLQAAHYATDPNYAKGLIDVMKSFQLIPDK